MAMPADLVNLRAVFGEVWWRTMLAKADDSQHLSMYKFISSLLHYLTYKVPSIFELVQ